MAAERTKNWPDAVEKVCMWLAKNAEHRSQSNSFGRQVVELIWQDGDVTIVNIDERTQIRPVNE